MTIRHPKETGATNAKLRHKRSNNKVMRVLLAVALGGILIDCMVSLSNRMDPQGIVIHHSALPGNEGLAVIAAFHKSRGFGAFYWFRIYHIGYHYIIFPDGSIKSIRPEHLRGAHARGANNMIGICVLGNFDSSAGKAVPTAAQFTSLETLSRRLMRKYGFTPAQIHRHCDIDGYTVCPGSNFPFQRLVNDLKASK
jgi:N-acetylmuramoyl-L-alanine amidase